MVASGLPERNGNEHATQIATLALHALSAITTFRIPHLPNRPLLARIGIHTGWFEVWHNLKVKESLLKKTGIL